MGELCNDLLESPYIQKFTEQDEMQNENNPMIHNRPQHMQDGHMDSQSQTDTSKSSTLHTNLQMMSNGVPSSKGGQPHVFSVENSSSMVMYNATVKNQNTNMKTEVSAVLGQNDPNLLFS